MDVGNRKAVAKHVGEAHKQIVGMKGPYPRTIMPQAGKSGTNQGDVNAALSAGDVNFKEPFVAKESAKMRDNLLEQVIKKTTI